MKNFKKLFLVPVLALGTVTSCYGGNDTKCPEEKKCETCPTADSTAKSLSVNYEEMNLLNGVSRKLIPTATPSNQTFTFKSSDESVATVTKEGLVTPVSEDKVCEITVQSSNGLSKIVKVYTYSEDRYYILSGTTYTGCVDPYIEEVNFAESTTNRTIATRAFSNFKYLKKVTLPANITSIGEYAFIGCTLLEYLKIESSDFKFGALAGELRNLKVIDIVETNTFYKTVNNNLLICPVSTGVTGDHTKAIVTAYNDFDGSGLEEVVTEYGLNKLSPFCFTYIKANTFNIPAGISNYTWFSVVHCEFETLNIPATSLSNLNNYATWFNFTKFKYLGSSTESNTTPNGAIIDNNCWISKDKATMYLASSEVRLDEISNIYPSLATIGSRAFLGRGVNAKKFKLPSNITTVGEYCFGYNNIEKVFLPSSLSGINAPGTVQFYGAVDKLDGCNMLDNGLSYYQSKLICNSIGAFFANNDNLTIYSDVERNDLQSKSLLISPNKNKFYNFEVKTEEEFDAL